MPRTIDQGFRDFHDKLKLVKSQSEAVKRHRASIESCLKSKFGMNRFFKTGSIGNGTNVNGYSDTDYFAGIPRDNLKNNSATTLREVKEALQATFPNTSGIVVDSPAVVVPFGTVASETTEVIPADFLRKEDGVNIYDIPDGQGGWMKSSPKAHNEYVTAINSNLSSKVKPLIRFVKAWAFYNSVPISSFYLEMRTAKFVSKESAIVYSIDLKAVLEHLQGVGLAAMNNPSGISGSIQPCKSTSQKNVALSKLQTAVTRARKARSAELDEDIKEAFHWWNMLFNSKFPSYYY